MKITFPDQNPAHPGPRWAFTLLEVALAIVITVGMLLVVMFFYRQAAQLRRDLLVESERIAALRLVFTQLTVELRSARPHDSLLIGLTGSSNSIQFLTTRAPSRAAWSRDKLGRVAQPQSDLREVSYELTWAGNPEEATGLMRSEAPVTEWFPFLDQVTNQNQDSDSEPSSDPASKGPSDIDTDPSPDTAAESNADLEKDLEQIPSEAQSDTGIISELLTEHLRFLKFRYWDGAAWQDLWNDLDLPVAVEVSLGGLPMPRAETLEEMDEEYPYELFRRVIYLTGKREMALSFDSIDTLLFEEPEPEVLP